jgi:flagellar basal body-associated protein FliL
MFKEKIQRKAKPALLSILLIFAISLSLIFYFLSSKSKKSQYQSQKFEHQIGVATGSEIKNNFSQSTSREVKDIYALIKNAIGDFYFENTEEIKAKEDGIPKLGGIYSNDYVIMTEKKIQIFTPSNT